MHIALKGVPYFSKNGNQLGTLKDWVNPVVSNGVTIAKDTTIPGAQLTAQNSLSTNLGNLVKTWDATVDTFNKNLFDGSDKSIDMLHNMITSGKVLELGYTVNEATVQKALENSIYGFLIPQAWPLSNLKVSPVVMYVDTFSPS